MLQTNLRVAREILFVVVPEWEQLVQIFAHTLELF